jgi:putative Mn2+ efflux pump MntP
MSVFSVVLLAIAVAIDGFWGGFAYGLRKIKIDLSSLVIISFWSVILTLITMLLGKTLMNYISLNTAKWIGAFLLIGIGIYAIKEGVEHRNKVKDEINSLEDGSLGLDENSTNLEINSKAILAGREEKEELTSRNPMVILFKVLGNPLLADFDKSGTISMWEGTILGLAVAMDASIAAFAVGIAGYNPFLTPLLFGLTHFVLIGLGNLIGRYRYIKNIGEKIVFIPGGILILIGLLRVL